MDLVALKTELQTDPGARGYAALVTAGDHRALAELLNATDPAIQIDREIVDAHEVFEQIDPADWLTRSAEERERISMILAMGTVNVKGVNTRAAFAAAFAGTTTLTNLSAFQSRDGSRAEELFGVGSVVTFAQIAEALAS